MVNGDADLQNIAIRWVTSSDIGLQWWTLVSNDWLITMFSLINWPRMVDNKSKWLLLIYVRVHRLYSLLMMINNRHLYDAVLGSGDDWTKGQQLAGIKVTDIPPSTAINPGYSGWEDQLPIAIADGLLQGIISNNLRATLVMTFDVRISRYWTTISWIKH